MLNSFSAEADILRCGYKIGYYEKSDIITWADKQIVAFDTPDDTILDLSMSHKTDPIEIEKLLLAIGENGRVISHKTQFGFIGLIFQSKQLTLEHAIRGLYSLVHENGISEAERGMLYHLDDGYDGALAGWYGTLAELEQEFIAFVEPYVQELSPQLVPRIKDRQAL